MTDLVVEFAGERFAVSDRLTFGRAGDIELDTNRHLHRLVGEFACRDGVWWLTNLGTRVFVTHVADDGSRSDLAPGASHTLTSERGTVRIAVGTARYQLDYEMPEAGRAPGAVGRSQVTDARSSSTRSSRRARSTS